MKKLLVIMVGCCFLLMSSLPVRANTKTTDAPTRVIHLVYDDSGSMINNENQKLDTWCQAKYAVEVFAAMLGEKDTMNVYVMSDFRNNNSASAKLELNGFDGANVNVGKVHEMVTRAGGTPFATVEKAYSDLTKVTADEKWLVVLTDGEFQGVENIDSFFSQKVSDINVMFLGMGPNADGITAKESENIYYAKAETSSDILGKITDICTRIFNSDRLDVEVTSKKFSFDVPMSELVVFAQGENVEINGIKNSDGKLIKSATKPVTVKYCETAATNYNSSEYIVDRNLLGSIVTFKDDFCAGEYTVDVTGAETIEIYYKPNVAIMAYLENSEGKTVTDLNALKAGSYTVKFGFVKAGTEEKVALSKLLGEVDYQAKITNNGDIHEKTYRSGDSVTLEEGPLKIDVTAHYLKYNTLTASFEYSVFKDKALAFLIVSNPQYMVASEGINAEHPMVVKTTIDGGAFTTEQWDEMGIPKVDFVTTLDFKMGEFKVEKTSELGIFHIYPSLKNEKPSAGTYSDCDFNIAYEEKHGNETWSGESKLTLKMQDTRSWIERNRDLFYKLAISGVLLFLLVGYLPFVKHYLPKRLAKKPLITCVPEVLGAARKYRSGSVEKNILSTIIPYIPQTGVIKYVPRGVTGVPPLSVKGTKNRRMSITNIRAFVGKENITFDGETIKEDRKGFVTSAGLSMCVNKGGWKYSCSLNQENR